MILLANDAAVEMLLKMACEYKTLDLDTVWMLIEFNRKIAMRKIPKKVLNIYPKEKGIFDWSEEEISTTINNIK